MPTTAALPTSFASATVPALQLNPEMDVHTQDDGAVAIPASALLPALLDEASGIPAATRTHLNLPNATTSPQVIISTSQLLRLSSVAFNDSVSMLSHLGTMAEVSQGTSQALVTSIDVNDLDTICAIPVTALAYPHFLLYFRRLASLATPPLPALSSVQVNEWIVHHWAATGHQDGTPILQARRVEGVAAVDAVHNITALQGLLQQLGIPKAKDNQAFKTYTLHNEEMDSFTALQLTAALGWRKGTLFGRSSMLTKLEKLGERGNVPAPATWSALGMLIRLLAEPRTLS